MHKAQRLVRKFAPAMLLTVTTAAMIAAPQSASATTAASCTAWGLTGKCYTASIPASSGHRVYYDVALCGWGQVYDTDNGHRVGGAHLVGTGYIGGLYGHYKLMVRSVSTTACIGVITS